MSIEGAQNPNWSTTSLHGLLTGPWTVTLIGTLLKGTLISTGAPIAGPRWSSLMRKPLICALWCSPLLSIKAPPWQCLSCFECWSVLRGKPEGDLHYSLDYFQKSWDYSGNIRIIFKIFGNPWIKFCNR